MHLGVVVNYKADADLYQVVYEDDFEAAMHDDTDDDIFHHDISADRVKTVTYPTSALSSYCVASPSPPLASFHLCARTCAHLR